VKWPWSHRLRESREALARSEEKSKQIDQLVAENRELARRAEERADRNHITEDVLRLVGWKGSR